MVRLAPILGAGETLLKTKQRCGLVKLTHKVKVMGGREIMREKSGKVGKKSKKESQRADMLKGWAK